MAKKRLNKQQVERIAKNQAAKLGEENAENGRIIKHSGHQIIVETQGGDRIICHIRRNLPPLVVGDSVCLEKDADKGVITTLLERKNLLKRQGRFGKAKSVAANIDQMLITIAAKPIFSLFLIDCYLAAAELNELDAVILYNKADMQDDENRLSSLNVYEELGYPLIQTSCIKNFGVETLNEILRNKASIFVGQSGVGKSSLIKTLLPDEEIETATISEKQALGRHTTTASYLYPLSSGGCIIDSPGVREFSLGTISLQQLFKGFKEFSPYEGQCRYRNCSHLGDQGCAIEKAVRLGKIADSRYASFQKLLREV